MKLFGKQAGANLNYVECGLPDKYPDQLRQCRDQRDSRVFNRSTPWSAGVA